MDENSRERICWIPLSQTTMWKSASATRYRFGCLVSCTDLGFSALPSALLFSAAGLFQFQFKFSPNSNFQICPLALGKGDGV